MKTGTIILAVILGWSTSVLTAGEITVIENGKSDYVIAVPDGEAGKIVRTAANALQKYLKESTGCELPVVCESAVENRPAFYLGKTGKGVRTGIPYDKLQDYIHCMKTAGKDIFLAGKDNSAGIKGGLDYHDRQYLGQLTGLNPQVRDRSYRKWHGTHKAVLSFLEKAGVVHFLLPGENGRNVISKKKLTVSDDLNEIREPAIPYCYGRNYGDLDTTIALNHNDIPDYKNYGGHSFGVAVPSGRFAKTHPEYFVMVNGKRRPEYGPAGGGHLCLSNQDVFDLMIKEIARQRKAGFRLVQVAPTDGQVPCECPQCKAAGSPGELQWRFFRKLAETVKQKMPDVKLVFLAYGHTKNPPKTFDTFPDNVIIEYAIWNKFEEKFEAWKTFRKIPKLAYVYLFGSYHAMIFSPVRSPKYVAQTIRILKENNVRGIYKCGWATELGLEGPVCYVFSRMLENPALDPDRLTDEFCRRAYGKACSPMKTFFSLLHSSLDTPGGHSIIDELERRPRNPEQLHLYAFSGTKIRYMRHHLWAAGHTAGLSDKEKARIRLVSREFQLLEMRVKLYALNEAFKAVPARELLEPIARELSAMDKLIDSWYDAKGAMKTEPGFYWPFLENVSKPVLRRGGGRIIGPFPKEFANGIAPLKQSMHIKTRPEDFQLYISRIPPYSMRNFQDTEHFQFSFAVPDFPTRIRAGYDRNNLYFRIECRFPAGNPSDFVQWCRTRPDLKTENLTIYLNMDPEKKQFCCFEFNPFGYRRQSRFGFHTDPLHPDAGKIDVNWTPVWECIAAPEEKKRKWTAFVTIPFKSLGTVCPEGKSWKINFIRNGKAMSLLPGDPDPASPAAYGRLVFQ